MPVEAYVADKWKYVNGEPTADGLDTVLHFEPGNKMSEVAGVPSPSIHSKVQGNVRNLGMWRVQIGDATWTQFGCSNATVWWLVYWVYNSVGADRVLLSTNDGTVLTNPEWNTLTSFLTSNGFSIATLSPTDTRGVLKDKVLEIFRTQA
jgi:hypothetical protein